MLWYELLVPAVLTALAIRLDSVLIGPYWAFAELVAGMGSIDAEWWYEQRTLRFGVVRRLLYVVAMGAALSALDEELRSVDLGIVGVTTAALLLWPIIFHGLPHGVFKSDWQLLPTYGGLVIAFGSLAIFWQDAHGLRSKPKQRRSWRLGARSGS
jgi:hypothetical protein